MYLIFVVMFSYVAGQEDPPPRHCCNWQCCATVICGAVESCNQPPENGDPYCSSWCIPYARAKELSLISTTPTPSTTAAVSTTEQDTSTASTLTTAPSTTSTTECPLAAKTLQQSFYAESPSVNVPPSNNYPYMPFWYTMAGFGMLTIIILLLCVLAGVLGILLLPCMLEFIRKF